MSFQEQRKRARLTRWLATVIGGFAIAGAFGMTAGEAMKAAAPPADPTTCIPTCAIDGRSLVVAGDDDTTLQAVEITIGLSFTVAGGPGNFQLFDGDRDSSNWDVPFNCGPDCPGTGAAAPELILELFADAAGVGGSGPALATWTPGAVPSGTEMGSFPTTNNDWNGVTFPQDPAAQSGSNYQYALHLKPLNPSVDRGWNGFKVRAQGTVLLLGNQIAGFLGAMNVGNAGQGQPPDFGDLLTIYPAYPALTPTTYDGTWSFRTRLPAFLSEVAFYDGDMDFGDRGCTYVDTDDPDSVGIPPFGVFGSFDEGVATVPGSACRTGLPAEDNPFGLYRRGPTIVPAGIAYQVRAPDGQVFLNQNSSGNREWEQFRIQLVQDAGDIPDGPCPASGYPEDTAKGYLASDCRSTNLPGGVWEIQLDGMDLANLNFWFFSFKVEPINTEYSIGRLVWYDANENQVQDLCSGVPCAAEPGIGGVAYTVIHHDTPGVLDGTVARTGFTSTVNVPGGLRIGEFKEEGLPAGNYEVVIDNGNFASGQPLEDLTSTTGGEIETGVEVGLEVCTDTGEPPDCGQPEYAEAIFGYVEKTLECVVTPAEPGIPPFIGAVHTFTNNADGTITMRTTLSKQFVDNTYGVNAIGWGSKGHKFSNLVGSDKIQMALFDTNDIKQLEFELDYITASNGAPGGYESRGVTGGDGGMILGSETDIVSADSSLAQNFRDGMVLTEDSPPTDDAYTPPAPPYANWIFEVWYDVTFKTDLFGGQAGFGYPRLTDFHASPSKTGNHSEDCVYPNEPPLAVADYYETTKNQTLTVAAPGVLDNDTDPSGSGMTAVLFSGPAHGSLVGGLNADGSFTYSPDNNFKGDDKFRYQASNINGSSTVAEVRIKVKK